MKIRILSKGNIVHEMDGADRVEVVVSGKDGDEIARLHTNVSDVGDESVDILSTTGKVMIRGCFTITTIVAAKKI